MIENIKYKASVFSTLFSEPYILRELYCALEGVSLATETPVNINTLGNALYMGRINDVSFEIGLSKNAKFLQNTALLLQKYGNTRKKALSA